MALLWSKKPKAEKNYSEESRKATLADKAVKAKSTKETKSSTKAVVVPSTAMPTGRFDDVAGAIIRPHITEKSGLLSQSGSYTFVVAKNANKASVGRAVKTLYKVTPVNVAIMNLPARNVFVKGRRGVVAGIRKAVVTVKKGDKIDFV